MSTGDPIESPRPVSTNGSHSFSPGPSPAPASASVPTDAPAVAVPGLEGVEWQTTYDRASVDRYLSDVEAERARLRADIEAAEARAASARALTERHQAADEARVGALVLATRAEIERIEREHKDAVDAIRSAALEKAARILEVARNDAASVNRAMVSMSKAVGADDARPVEADEAPGVVAAPRPDPEERIDAS